MQLHQFIKMAMNGLAKNVPAVVDGPWFLEPLNQLLVNDPDQRVELDHHRKPIGVHSVIKWDRLGYHGWRRGTYLSGYADDTYGIYRRTGLTLPDLEQIVETLTIDNWECEIQQVVGLAATRHLENLDICMTLDEFAVEKAAYWAEEVTEDRLQRLQEYYEVRIFHGGDSFGLHEWDSRLFLINAGGSHRFAAARYIARQIGKQVALQGKLRISLFNRSAIDTLTTTYELFVVKNETTLNDISTILQSAKIPHYFCDLPTPIEESKIIFLPRANRRSMMTASILRNANLFDLGQYLVTFPLLNSVRNIIEQYNCQRGGRNDQPIGKINPILCK
jgi:hypothetical protein